MRDLIKILIALAFIVGAFLIGEFMAGEKYAGQLNVMSTKNDSNNYSIRQMHDSLILLRERIGNTSAQNNSDNLKSTLHINHHKK